MADANYFYPQVKCISILNFIHMRIVAYGFKPKLEKGHIGFNTVYRPYAKTTASTAKNKIHKFPTIPFKGIVHPDQTFVCRTQNIF